MTNREIDALIATHVFGMRWYSTDVPNPCPHYSTQIQDAWEVVMKMRENEIHMAVECVDYGPANSITNGFFAYCWRPKVDPDNKHIFGSTFDSTAPLAICKSALKALGIDASEGKVSND